jgi:hypothetical protein
MFLQQAKTKLERKHAVHFPRRTLNDEKRKPKYKDSIKQPNPILSMKAKTKRKPKKLLNVNEKFVFSNQQVQEKQQKLNFQPIPGSQPVRYTQLYRENDKANKS